MTCTCTHSIDAHVIQVTLDGLTQPCERTECPCGDYQEVDGE